MFKACIGFPRAHAPVNREIVRDAGVPGAAHLAQRADAAAAIEAGAGIVAGGLMLHLPAGQMIGQRLALRFVALADAGCRRGGFGLRGLQLRPANYSAAILGELSSVTIAGRARQSLGGRPDHRLKAREKTLISAYPNARPISVTLSLVSVSNCRAS